MRTSVLIIGIVFIVLGVFAFYYYTTETDEDLGGLIENEERVYPFRPYAYPLVIGGIVLVILSFLIPSKKEMRESSYTVTPVSTTSNLP